MSDAPAPNLPPDLRHHLIHELCLTLPPPLTDTPEHLALRNRLAIALVIELSPATVLEADHAAHYVAASQHSMACLRLAQQPDMPPQWVLRCRAQAISMMRQAQGALRHLQRLQAARREADTAATSSQPAVIAAKAHVTPSETNVIATTAEAVGKQSPAHTPAQPAAPGSGGEADHAGTPEPKPLAVPAPALNRRMRRMLAAAARTHSRHESPRPLTAATSPPSG